MMDENPKDKIQNPKNKGQSILSLTEPYPRLDSAIIYCINKSLLNG
jgi:hypothetical protein